MATLSRSAQLLVEWYSQHPEGLVPLAPSLNLAQDPPSPTLAVLSYDKWIKMVCKCCGTHGCHGLWDCQFKTQRKQLLMCAACGMGGAYSKWTGYFGPKLIGCKLIITLTYGSIDENRTGTDC